LEEVLQKALEARAMMNLSKRIFETTKMAIYLEAKTDRGPVRIAMRFPDVHATYSEFHSRNVGSETDARKLIFLGREIMTALDHLPHVAEVREKAASFWASNHVVHDGPQGKDASFARPLAHKLPDETGACPLVLEAELDTPFVLNRATKLRFVVEGFEGSTTESKATAWITPSQLIQAAHKTFGVRKHFLSELKRRVAKIEPNAEVEAVPHDVLGGGSVMCYANNDVLRGIAECCPTAVDGAGAAELLQFSMAWTGQGKRRALCIGSVAVCINFQRPSTSIPKCECPMCFEDVLAPEWTCPQCKHAVHRICMDAWKDTCDKKAVAATCPLCRHEI
jgi:hypothetical protein